MKQAILITSYKNYPHLKRILNYFDDDFYIYIHLDKKSEISSDEIEELTNHERVKFFCQKYKVNWGGLNHLRSILFLAKKALENKENFYFHLISGQDYPIQTCEKFKRFFSNNREKNFLNYFNVPFEGWGTNGGLDRLEYYNFYDFFDAKKIKQSLWIIRIQKVQQRIGLKRGLPKTLSNLYGGSTWWSLNRQALEYCITFSLKNKAFLNRFKYTFCSEEFYFQTILLNSDLKDTISQNTLRFINWKKNHWKKPSILIQDDFAELVKSEAFFARKFEYPDSLEILDSIEKRLKLDTL